MRHAPHLCLTSSLLLLLVAIPLLAQPGEHDPRTMFVTFDKAAVYEAADYRSSILGTLRRGDSVVAIGSDRMYTQVRSGSIVGYVLRANLSDKPLRFRSTVQKRKLTGGTDTAKPSTKRSSDAGAHYGSAATAAPASSAVTIDSSTTAPVRAVGKPGTKASPSRSRPTGTNAIRPQCAALTRSGKQCSRRAGDSSIYCWQHKK